MNPYPPGSLAIVTGGDEGHAPYLRACLNSLAVHNDARLPIHVLDLGLGEQTLIWIATTYPDVVVLPASEMAREIDHDIAVMRARDGVAFLPWLPYVLGTMRKLCLAEWSLSEFWLWLDADTLLLHPISELLRMMPPQRNRIYAGRDSARGLEFHFKDRNPMVRRALARLQLDQHGPSVMAGPTSWNSGVVLAHAPFYAELVQFARRTFLHDYGPYVVGDQAVVNIAMSLRGLRAAGLPWGVNVSIDLRRQQDISLLTGVRSGSGRSLPGLGIAFGGREADEARLYHFLGIKPLDHPDREHPVVQLFDWWREAVPLPA